MANRNDQLLKTLEKSLTMEKGNAEAPYIQKQSDYLANKQNDRSGANILNNFDQNMYNNQQTYLDYG